MKTSGSGIAGKPRVAAVPNKGQPAGKARIAPKPSVKKAGTPAQAAISPLDTYSPAADDMRTLMRAHAIKSDKKRHGAVKAHAKAYVSMASKVASGGEPDADDQGNATNKNVGNYGV